MNLLFHPACAAISMNRIRLLSEQVANQIAAGEVVERPASVVKELVENSLDAGATRLAVEIHAGGRSLIRVTDDGAGMSRDDALLCLERHATSKILRAEDLSAISTLGFRGEALPSIASVSRFTLTTRERGSAAPEGTEILVNGGKIIAVKSCGSAPGACVEVRQLFFNLPARRKFMRADETESAHIQHYLTLAALAFPGVALEFVKDARLVWQLPAVRKEDRLAALRERWAALREGGDKLLPVDFTGDLPATRDETGLPERRHSPASVARLGAAGRAGRLPLQPGRAACVRQPPPGGKSRDQFRPVGGLPHGVDERPLSGLLPVSGSQPGGGGCQHPPGQARGEIPSRKGGAPIAGPGGSGNALEFPRPGQEGGGPARGGTCSHPPAGSGPAGISKTRPSAVRPSRPRASRVLRRPFAALIGAQRRRYI